MLFRDGSDGMPNDVSSASANTNSANGSANSAELPSSHSPHKRSKRTRRNSSSTSRRPSDEVGSEDEGEGDGDDVDVEAGADVGAGDYLSVEAEVESDNDHDNGRDSPSNSASSEESGVDDGDGGDTVSDSEGCNDVSVVDCDADYDEVNRVDESVADDRDDDSVVEVNRVDESVADDRDDDSVVSVPHSPVEVADEYGIDLNNSDHDDGAGAGDGDDDAPTSVGIEAEVISDDESCNDECEIAFTDTRDASGGSGSDHSMIHESIDVDDDGSPAIVADGGVNTVDGTTTNKKKKKLRRVITSDDSDDDDNQNNNDDSRAAQNDPPPPHVASPLASAPQQGKVPLSRDTVDICTPPTAVDCGNCGTPPPTYHAPAPSSATAASSAPTLDTAAPASISRSGDTDNDVNDNDLGNDGASSDKPHSAALTMLTNGGHEDVTSPVAAMHPSEESDVRVAPDNQALVEDVVTGPEVVHLTSQVSDDNGDDGGVTTPEVVHPAAEEGDSEEALELTSQPAEEGDCGDYYDSDSSYFDADESEPEAGDIGSNHTPIHTPANRPIVINGERFASPIAYVFLLPPPLCLHFLSSCTSSQTVSRLHAHDDLRPCLCQARSGRHVRTCVHKHHVFMSALPLHFQQQHTHTHNAGTCVRQRHRAQRLGGLHLQAKPRGAQLLEGHPSLRRARGARWQTSPQPSHQRSAPPRAAR
jgi:hypothetical protein